MSWAQTAGDGGPQTHGTHHSAAFWDRVWAGTSRAGINVISTSGM